MPALTAADLSHDRDFARALDAHDDLAQLRGRFALPLKRPDDIYFVGNSLGPMPHAARTLVQEELDDWSRLGVAGHMSARRPWFSYHEQLRAPLARLVGAREHEVVAMNSLTANLHLLMTTFYRPDAPGKGRRTKLLIEKGAFPSDTYAAMSHVAARGLDPNEHVVEIAPRAGEWTIREDDLDARIAELGDTLALAMLPGVQYRTGQAFDIARHTRAAHAVGARCGWDLAHAAGNLALSLHDSDADFAVWCSYKYLNSGRAPSPARSSTSAMCATPSCRATRAGGATIRRRASGWRSASSPRSTPTRGACRTRRSWPSRRSSPVWPSSMQPASRACARRASA